MNRVQVGIVFILLAVFCVFLTAEAATGDAAAKVTKMTVSVSGPVNLGDDEVRYDLTGAITVNGPTEVEYIWLRNDDVKVHPVQKLVFTAAGTKNVTTYWKVTKTGQVQNLWVELKVLRPNQVISKQVEIKVPAIKR